LKSSAGKAPIKIVLFNVSGADIYIYRLDAAGQRIRYGTIGDNRSLPIMTSVASPWIVTDRSGQCLEIVMPGQRTRYLRVDPARSDAQRDRPRRAVPLAGSEDALRQLIDALARGEPSYDRMTPEVAAETRQQLLLDQAILAKLGQLRALSFRGVTQMGGDIYTAHFANGSAEWRIGLTRDGRIERIALGPQW
jgi:hypothetical protein